MTAEMAAIKKKHKDRLKLTATATEKSANTIVKYQK